MKEEPIVAAALVRVTCDVPRTSFISTNIRDNNMAIARSPCHGA